MSYIKAPAGELQEYYDYLEELRQSGATNMFGAATYLKDAFDELSEKRSREILADWMKGHNDPKRVIKP